MTGRLVGGLLVLLVVLILPARQTSAGEPTAWSTLAPYPHPITNNAVTSVCDGGTCTIYSFMGMTDPTDTSTITAKSYKLTSPGTGSWIPIADAPLLSDKAKIAASAVNCAGDVYLIGGYTAAGFLEVTEHRLFRYDPTGNTYAQLADVPTEVDDTVAGVYQERYIYLVSGWHGPTGSNTTAVQVYDTQTDTWRQATPIPVGGRFGHAGGAVGDRLVFIDGSADTPGFPVVHSTLVGAIDSADPGVITWTQPGASPFSQTYRAADSQGPASCDWLFFVGGTDNSYNFNGTGYNGQPSNPLDQVMAYRPASGEWMLIDDSGGAAHTPTMDHRGLVWFDGKWVTVGGMTGPGVATDFVNALSIPGVCAVATVPAATDWGLLFLALLVLAFGTALLKRRHQAT